MLRHLGYPARARAGFSAYFGAFRGDHWVSEYFAEEKQRWILVDAELDERLITLADIDFDPCDVPRDEWLSAADAWSRCRAGDDDPENYGFDPSDSGLQYICAQLLRDCAALNGIEVGSFDRWGVATDSRSPAKSEAALLDQLADSLRQDALEVAHELFADERLSLAGLPADAPLDPLALPR